MAGLVAANEGVLVDCQPVVVLRLVEVDQADGASADLPALTHLDRNAVGEVAVEAPVIEKRRGGVGTADDTDRLFDGGGPKGRVDPLQRRPQSAVEKDLAVVGALWRLGVLRDLSTFDRVVAQVAQPGQQRLLKDRFPAQVVHGGAERLRHGFLGLLDPDLAGHQLGQQEIAELGERLVLPYVALHEVEQRTDELSDLCRRASIAEAEPRNINPGSAWHPRAG